MRDDFCEGNLPERGSSVYYLSNGKLSGMCVLGLEHLPDALPEKPKARVEMQPRVDEKNTVRLLGQGDGMSAGSEEALRHRARQLRGRTPLYLREEARRTAVETGRA
jgi:hypothetical protein